MNIIFKKRIKLIRAMINANKSFSLYGLKYVINEIIETTRKDNDGFYLSISEDEPNRVSYLRSSSHKVRTKTTLQRFIRRQLGYDGTVISDSNLDKFCNLVLLLIDDTIANNVELISGPEISKYYSNTTILSCMTGTCYSHKTSIYSMNKNVQMAVFNKEVRALLWLSDNGTYILDRAYPAGHWGVEFIRTWALKKGYVVRNNPDSITTDTNNGLSDNTIHYITLKHDETFPYMDTFKYGKKNGANLVVSNDPSFGNLVFTCTDGTVSKKLACHKCGSVCSDIVNYYNVLNEFGKNIVHCEKCYKTNAFKCNVCYTWHTNTLRYRDWDMCTSCRNKLYAFSKHNICTCYNCSTSKKKYESFIKEETLREFKAKKQLIFDFIEQ